MLIRLRTSPEISWSEESIQPETQNLAGRQVPSQWLGQIQARNGFVPFRQCLARASIRCWASLLLFLTKSSAIRVISSSNVSGAGEPFAALSDDSKQP